MLGIFEKLGLLVELGEDVAFEEEVEICVPFATV